MLNKWQLAEKPYTLVIAVIKHCGIYKLASTTLLLYILEPDEKRSVPEVTQDF